MRWSIQLARVRGIPVRIHLTFGLLIAFLAWRAGGAGGVLGAILEISFLFLVFACVVLHEFGHAITAMKLGVPIVAITLYPFGGVANLGRRPRSSREELLIAAAGPLVNLVIAGLLAVSLVSINTGTGASLDQRLAIAFASTLMWANLILAGFNLLPAFPLDGGRILRAALAPSLGWVRATVWAASAGQVLGAVFLIAGLLHEPWLALAGILILPGANAELRLALAARQAERWRAADIAITSVRDIEARARLDEIQEEMRDDPAHDFVVIEDGRAVAYLPAARVLALLAEPGGATRLAVDAAYPITLRIPAATPIRDALDRLRAEEAEIAVLEAADGVVIGVVRRSALERALSMAEALARSSRDHS